MRSVFFYLLQVVASSGLLYGYYHFFLRNKKFHQYNRYYLLGATLVSILVPFLNIPLYFSQQEYQQTIWLQTLSDLSSPSVFVVAGESANSALSIFTWQNMLIGLYILAGLLFLSRLVTALMKIRKLLRKYKTEKLEDVYFVNTEEKDTPFSFFRWMFWNHKVALQSSDGQQMFRHELFHIKQKHTWDTLFMEILNCVFWINPFFYLMRRELKVIHEFLADQFAIRETDQSGYAELLLMHLLGSPHLRLTHPFFHNQIKRRIAMITSSQQPKYQYLRKVLVLPLLAIVALLFAFTYKQKQEALQLTETPVISLTLTETPASETMPQVDSVPTKLKLTKAAPAEVVVEGKKRQADEPVTLSLAEIPGNPLYVINGVLIDKGKSHDVIGTIRPNDIREINVLKGEQAISQYGQAGAEGVLEINTRSYDVAITEGKKTKAAPNEETALLLKEVTGKADKQPENSYAEVVVTGYPSNAPRFPGGDAEWVKFLQRNLKSEVPVENGAPPGKYKVTVFFQVDENGKLSNIKASTKLGYGMEEEVVRLLESGPDWEPAMQDGKAVKAYRKQPVTFIVLPDNAKEVVVSGYKKEPKELEVAGFKKEPNEMVVQGYKKGTKEAEVANPGKEPNEVVVVGYKKEPEMVVEGHRKEEKEVEVTGFSKPKALKLNEVNMDKLSPIYPNPANSTISIPFSSPKDGAGEIRFHDLNGNTALTTKTSLVKGLNTLTANVASLKPGVYMITVIDPSGSPARVYKLVKQ